MKHASIVKAVSKVAEVKQVDARKFYAHNEKKRISWFVYQDNETASFVKVHRHSEKEDLQSDYCAGWLHDTIKSAIQDFIKD